MTEHLAQLRQHECRDLWYVTSTYVESITYPLTASAATSHLHRFHLALLAYLCGSKEYNKPAFRQIEPQMYSWLDVPGSKPKHYQPSSVPVHASTFHHHSILIALPLHHEKLAQLTDRKAAAMFADENRKFAYLRSLNVQSLGADLSEIKRVVDYCSSYAQRDLTDELRFQIFPQSASEFRSTLA